MNSTEYGQYTPAVGTWAHRAFRSRKSQALLTKHGFVYSRSRKGNCRDKAVVERFFLILKIERVWQRTYANQAEARIDSVSYIVGFYNNERLISVLGNPPPAVFERKLAETKPIIVAEIT